MALAKKVVIMAASTFKDFVENARTPRMRAIARIALSRRMTQTSMAAALGLDSSNVRRHFESKSVHQKTAERYISVLAHGDIERRLMSQYLDVVDNQFGGRAALSVLANQFRALEPALLDGALPRLLAAIEAIDDATLLPALQAYLRTSLEMSLFLTIQLPDDASPVERALNTPIRVFADAIREHVDVAEFLAPRQPADDCLWLLWGRMRFPGVVFTDEDAEAIIATAAGRLLRRGIDPTPMLHYLDRRREHTARQVALAEASIAQSKATPAKRRRTK